MDSSSMDLTEGCGTLDATRRDLLESRDKIEALVQENHGLRKKNDILGRINLELENEITSICSKKDNEKSKHQNLLVDLEAANVKIKQLEDLVEEEKNNVLLYKDRPFKENPKQETLVLPDQEQLNILTGQINNLQLELENTNQECNELIQEKASFSREIHQLKYEKQTLQEELAEVKQLLGQKSQDIRNLNETIESIREEKMLISTELNLLKSSDTNAARGNSLFAEVEDNRQKMAAEREIIKMKYLRLKNVLTQRLAENNKLKMEIIKIKRTDQDDEKAIRKDYTDLLATYETKIQELEQRVQTLQQENPEKPPIPNKDGENFNYQWVNTVVEEARKKSRALQEELDYRGSNYVLQGHKLFDTQKENRKLRNTISKMQGDIEELKLKFESVKTVQEEKDGISPPVLEEVTKYKKLKAVTFNETAQNQSNTVHNISTNNTSSDNLNKTDSKSEDVERTLEVDQGSDKEN